MLSNKQNLLDYLTYNLTPKDIERKQFGEIFTPIPVVEQMLNLLPVELWSDPTTTWFDPCVGIGNFMVCVYYRLFEGLREKIPDDVQRSQHIITKMLYMMEINPKNIYVCQLIFGQNANIHNCDTLAQNFSQNYFSVIVGNPPYATNPSEQDTKPLYNLFIEKLIDQCHYFLFIVPSRWFAGGKGLDKFRKQMLNRTDIQYICHYDDATKIFGNIVDIKGGVNYFLKNKFHNESCDYNGQICQLNKYDILINPLSIQIVEYLLNYPKITSIYMNRNYYGIETNDKRLTDNGNIICNVSLQKSKNRIKYVNIDPSIYTNKSHWKVITSRASGKGNDGFGFMTITSPYEIYTNSYIGFRCNSEDEARSLLSYLQCRLANYMLSIRKISQDINESSCKWIPLPPLDRIWNDQLVNEYYKLL